MGIWGSFVERISSKLAFFPPDPPTYEVLDHADGSGESYIKPKIRDIPKILSCQVSQLPVTPAKGGEGEAHTMVVVFFPYKPRLPGGGTRLTLVYSHGNAVDLGQMMPVYRDLSRLLRVNVVGYDYSGYGVSGGEPSVGNTLANISAVMAYLKDAHNIHPPNVLLYGQSVGSGPTAWMASHLPDLAGVVFHSPLLSGVRVFSPGLRWWPSWADVYPNHLLAPKIRCPALVLHGTDDEVIDVSCGKKLHELLPNAVAPLWAEGFNHQNLELAPEFFPVLQAFVKRVHDAAPEFGAAPSTSS